MLEKEAEIIERLAFGKSSLLVFSSQWAANSSINHYGVNQNKVRVIPFGANIERIPSEISPRPKGHICRLLFIGKYWVRKGGKIAFDTLLELEKMGLEAELIVCGCSPPKSLSHPNVKVIQWVKSIEDLLAWANFLLLPTRADCTPIVFSEACAYGVPIISTDTGGISSVVTNGENGYLLDLSATAVDYAQLIFDIWNNDQLYASLRVKSRRVFSERLNWDSWGKSMCHVITEAAELRT
jgi:glycosyltransferase involved in cell wall biosynthesis